MKIKFFLIFCLLTVNSTFADECALETCIKCEQNCNNENCQISCNKDNLFGKTFFSVRPQDSNSARKLMNLANRTKLLYEGFCGSVGFSIAWQNSFDKDKDAQLGKWFFFNGKNCMTVGTPGNGQIFDVNANQIGMSLGNISLLPNPILTPGFIGEVCINPEIENLIFDLDIRFDLDHFMCGLWTEFDFVFARTRTNLNLKNREQVKLTQQIFPPGFMTLGCVTSPVPYLCIQDAFKGDKEIGVIPELMCGKFSQGEMVKSGLAGIHIDLGYDFVKNERGYFAAALDVVIPTGTRPSSKFLFEPVVGANKSWQVGGILQGAYVLNPYSDKKIAFHFNSVITHLFKSRQERLFSLKNNGPGSQYLLLKEFVFLGQEGGSNLIGGQRAANILCGEADIGADVMFDGSIMLQLNLCRTFFNLGYNLWARSKEKIDDTICLKNFAENRYGIKGDFPLTKQTSFTCDQAFICATDPRTASNSTIAQSSTTDIENGEESTIFIQPSDIDFCTPLHPNAISHKIFGSIGFNYNTLKNFWYFQVCGELEFSPNNRALNQWALTFQAGASF